MPSSHTTSSGLDALFEVPPRPSLWQKLWDSPCVFIAQKVYALTQTATPLESIARPVTVVCISDTHSAQIELPKGDLLIHAGDLTKSGSFRELQASIDWLRSQPHQHKVVIAGNHDVLLDDDFDHRLLYQHDARKRQDIDWGDVVYLQDSAITFTCANGRQLKIFGSPRSVRNGNWAFQHPRSQDVWSGAVPNDTDILITHGPPRAHLDLLNLGCINLLGELWRVRPTLHVFGHVHEGHGTEILDYSSVQDAFEKTIVSRGGKLNLLNLIKETVLCWCRRSTPTSRTLLVNPAIASGLRDEPKQDPIVVTI